MIKIYGLIDPRDNRIRYVGKTKRDLDKRLNEHLMNVYLKNNTYKNKWIKKLLKLQLCPIIILLEECNENGWELREEYWIRYYKDKYNDLTNATSGGEGLNNPTIEVRKKISIKNKGRKCSLEEVENRRIVFSGEGNPFYGKKHSEETKKKLSNYFLGKKHTLETKEKLRLLATGRKNKPEDIFRNKLSKKKKDPLLIFGLCKYKNKYIARLITNGKHYFSKVCNTREEAGVEYDKLAEKYLGKLAVYNFRHNDFSKLLG